MMIFEATPAGKIHVHFHKAKLAQKYKDFSIEELQRNGYLFLNGLNKAKKFINNVKNGVIKLDQSQIKSFDALKSYLGFHS